MRGEVAAKEATQERGAPFNRRPPTICTSGTFWICAVESCQMEAFQWRSRSPMVVVCVCDLMTYLLACLLTYLPT